MTDDEHRGASPGAGEHRDGSGRVRSNHLHSARPQAREGLGEIGRSRQKDLLGTSFRDADRDGRQARMGRRRAEHGRIHSKEGRAPKYGTDVVGVANPLERDGRALGSHEEVGDVLDGRPTPGSARHHEAFVVRRFGKPIDLALADLGTLDVTRGRPSHELLDLASYGPGVKHTLDVVSASGKNGEPRSKPVDELGRLARSWR
jgi:hypothetical protein